MSDQQGESSPFPWALLAVCAVALIGAVFIGAILAPRDAPRPTPPATTPATAPVATAPPAGSVPTGTAPVPTATTSTTVAPTTTTADPLTSPTPPVESDVTGIAGSFLSVYLTAPAESRAREIEPLVTSDLALQLAQADRIPNATPVGVTYLNSDGLLATVRFTLSDGTTGTLTLVNTAAGWRVSAIADD